MLDHSSACAVLRAVWLFQLTPHVSAATSSICAKMAKPIARNTPGALGGVNSARSAMLGMVDAII
jgi:hypothetical protein